VAANRQSNTAPDVTAVTVMFNRLPAALENTSMRRPGPGVGSGFGFFADRVFAAMSQISFGKGSGRSLTPDASLPRFVPPDR
jgi:hypothetical protein